MAPFRQAFSCAHPAVLDPFHPQTVIFCTILVFAFGRQGGTDGTGKWYENDVLLHSEGRSAAGRMLNGRVDVMFGVIREYS